MTTEENLSTATATVDQVDPLRAICKIGKMKGKTRGWMERLQVEEMRGMVKEMVVLRRNRESNMESSSNSEQKEA